MLVLRKGKPVGQPHWESRLTSSLSQSSLLRCAVTSSFLSFLVAKCSAAAEIQAGLGAGAAESEAKLTYKHRCRHLIATLLATRYLCLTARGSPFKHKAGLRVTTNDCVCLLRDDLIGLGPSLYIRHTMYSI